MKNKFQKNLSSIIYLCNKTYGFNTSDQVSDTTEHLLNSLWFAGDSFELTAKYVIELLEHNWDLDELIADESLMLGLIE